jgi:hypothetical protein
LFFGQLSRRSLIPLVSTAGRTSFTHEHAAVEQYVSRALHRPLQRLLLAIRKTAGKEAGDVTDRCFAIRDAHQVADVI